MPKPPIARPAQNEQSVGRSSTSGRGDDLHSELWNSIIAKNKKKIPNGKKNQLQVEAWLSPRKLGKSGLFSHKL